MEQASSYHIHIGLHAVTVLAMANDHIVDVTLCYTSNRSYTRDAAGEVEDRPGHVQTCESQEGFCTQAILASLFLKTQVNADQV